ncbi:MAG: bifunctional metallophosphatase/5'-nucleotidase [Anaerolineae bacterium]|nr:bifunctional metallophosphatase/5'-nucleotidase [Gemmatimonadaceae bacterium]
MTSLTRCLAIIVAIVLVACAPAGRPAVGAPAKGPVRFLLVNDVYILDTLRDGTGGLSRIAAMRDSLERSGPVVFVLAGDVFSPSLLSKWYAGRHTLDGFNVAGLDYATFGNHEFELSRDTLIARISASRFTWLSANCGLAEGAPFPGVRSWDTLTVNGVRVGLFGLTLTLPYARYVRCTDPDSAAHAAIIALKAAGSDVVVGVTHQRLHADSALLLREPDLDMILGGHEHEQHTISAGNRFLVKADANSRSAQLVTVTAGAGNTFAQRTDILNAERGMRMDPAVERVAQAWRDSLIARLGPERAIGTLSVEIDARDAALRRQEMPFGDLVADAIRFGTGADVALLNSGALRFDDVIAAGEITNYQLESVFLFADETRIVTFPLTGARLRELLEHGVSAANYKRGGFLQVSGVVFGFDSLRADGSRVVGDITREDARLILPAETVRVSFASYPACFGGDGYKVPEASAGDACKTGGTAPRAVDLLKEHIVQRLGGKVGEPRGGRIIRLESR